MNNYKSILLIMVLVIATIFLDSCRDDDSPTENNQSVADYVLFVSEMNDLIYLTEQATSDFDSRMRVSENDCKSVVHYPEKKQIVMDFSNNSCVLDDGRGRSGKIVIDYTDNYRETNSQTLISLDNYYSGTTKLRGKIKVKNTGNDQYEVMVESLRFPIGDEDSAKVSGTLTRKWLIGQNTIGLEDDQYQFEGTLTGMDRKEQDFEARIVSPLIINYPCFEDGYTFPVRGIVDIDTESFLTREIDYGQIDCDKNIVLTIDGESQTVRY
jgi:hypothetical protein